MIWLLILCLLLIWEILLYDVITSYRPSSDVCVYFFLYYTLDDIIVDVQFLFRIQCEHSSAMHQLHRTCLFFLLHFMSKTE